jgi:hypothetical protein
MIAKMIKGASFSGCVSYVMEKEQSIIIDAKDIRTENAILAANDFIRISEQNDRVTKPVMHIAISFHRNDSGKVSNQDMQAIGREIIHQLGYGNCQYLMVRHEDQQHPHFHIVINRVDKEGKLVSDKMDYLRIQKVIKELEKQYPHLTPATQKNLSAINTDRLRGKNKDLIELYKYIDTARLTSKTLLQFRSKLQEMGILTELKYKRGSITEVQGIKFLYKGKWISGSKIDKSCSYSKLVAALAANKQQQAKKNSHINYQEATNKGTTQRGVVNDTIFNDDMFSAPKRGI